MREGMDLRSLSDRLILSYARPRAYLDKTQAILGRLGYQIIAESEFSAARGGGAEPLAEPDLLIAEEERLEDVEKSEWVERIPLIALTGRARSPELDSRAVAVVKRPAGLHDLYRVLQALFEETPRTTPRVPTALYARCAYHGRPFEGELVSLSENGGLLRVSENLPLGSCFQLSVDLPTSGPIELRAEAAYRLAPNLGVVFSGLPSELRVAIGDFVHKSILS